MDEHNKRLTNRFRFAPTIEDGLEHALYGVQAKKYKNEPALIDKRERSQRPIKSDDPTEILSWLRDNREWFMEHYESDQLIEGLIDAADAIAGNQINEQVKLAHNKLSSTRGVCWMRFLAIVASELSVSLKQTCVNNEFIIKKLLDYDCYMLIKPTSKESHIFYSLLISKPCTIPDKINIFREWIETDTCYITKWHSVQYDKLQNLITLPELFVNSWFTFRRHVKPESHDIFENLESDQTTFEHAMMCAFVAIDDKEGTEEIITYSRFAYMESFVCAPYHRHPSKILSKLDFRPRSLMQVFLTHQLTLLCELIEKEPAVIAVGDKTDCFTGLWSLFTLEPVSAYEMVLDISATGYFKNKNTKSEGNHFLKVIKKVIKYEDSVYLIDFDKFYDYKPTLLQHEFDLELLKYATESLLKKIERFHGADIPTMITEEFFRQASQKTWLDLSTLKASCTADPTKRFPDVDPNKNQKESKREKMIMRVLKGIEDGDIVDLCPYSAIDEWVKASEDKGGLVVDLFKKAQHGGLREIFVLEFDSRVNQSFIELLSRVCCGTVGTETMTHPDYKGKMPTEHVHKTVLSKAFDDGYSVYTRKMNDDAQKWSQTHHPGKLGVPLFKMTLPILHPIIARILNLWVGRQLLLPAELLKVLMGGSQRTYKDEEYTKLQDAFDGKIKVEWMNPGEKWITLVGGMMQGILHYTSSFFHCALQELNERVTTNFFRENHPTVKLIYSHQTSSDDSGVIATIIGKLTEVAKRDLDLLLFMKWSLSERLAIYPSIEKSTPLTEKIYEFNSDYYVRAGRLRPVNKWISSCLVIISTETMIERQEHFTNMRTQLIEGGAPIMLSRAVNISQLRVLYRMLGYGINDVAPLYLEDLLCYPEPHYGFVLLDPSTLSGIVDFKLNHFRLLNATSLGDDYIEEMKTKDLQVTESGRAIRLTYCTFGNYKKMRRLIDSVCRLGWREDIEQDPLLLLRKPETLDEIAIILTDRLHKPGVALSLDTGNILSRTLASSVYLITSPAMSTRGCIFDESGILIDKTLDSYKKTRVSLSNLLANRMVSTTTDGPKDLEPFFPLYASYLRVQLLHHAMSTSQLELWTSSIKMKSKVKVYNVHRDHEYTILELCRYLWLGDTLRTGETHIQTELIAMQKVYPWLVKDYKEALRLSPYSNYRSMMNFVLTTDVKSRFVVINGAPIKHDATLEALCRRGQWPGIKLKEVLDNAPDDGNPDVEVKYIRHGLSMIMGFGYIGNTTKYVVEYLESISEESASGLSRGDQYDKALYVMWELVNTYKTPVEHYQTIKRLKKGIVGGFTKAQKFDPKDAVYKGEGLWEGMVDGHPVELHVRDEYLIEIVCCNITFLKEALGSIKSICADMGWTPRGDRIPSLDQEVLTKHFKIEPSEVSFGARITYSYLPNISLTPETDLELCANSRSIRLVTTFWIEGIRKQFSVLSWSSRAYHILPRDKLIRAETRYNFRPIIQSWILNSPQSPELSRIYTADLKGLATHGSAKADASLRWVQTQLRDVAHSLGWDSRVLQSLPEVIPTFDASLLQNFEQVKIQTEADRLPSGLLEEGDFESSDEEMPEPESDEVATQRFIKEALAGTHNVIFGPFGEGLEDVSSSDLVPDDYICDETSSILDSESGACSLPASLKRPLEADTPLSEYYEPISSDELLNTICDEIEAQRDREKKEWDEYYLSKQYSEDFPCITERVTHYVEEKRQKMSVSWADDNWAKDVAEQLAEQLIKEERLMRTLPPRDSQAVVDDDTLCIAMERNDLMIVDQPMEWKRSGLGTLFHRSYLENVDEDMMGDLRKTLKHRVSSNIEAVQFCNDILGIKVSYSSPAPGEGVSSIIKSEYDD
uniref:RNA-directed RNA polymerase L n=1 Tax=Wuhan Millipede Virus 1 TaxID=1608124 RepID=A0A0B5KKI9_9VIRU|nr:RNA-dependent RNA polymerase [Wuhan Millipede Virus 1]